MLFLKAIKTALAGEKPLTSSEKAQQRLHILLINDRAGKNTLDFLPQMKQEIIEVVKKYVPLVDNDDVEINYSDTEDTKILEMSVSIETLLQPNEHKESDKSKA